MREGRRVGGVQIWWPSCDALCCRSSLSSCWKVTWPSAGEGDRGLDMPLLRNSRCTRTRPCTMSCHAQPVASGWRGWACLIIWPRYTGVGCWRGVALTITALYHCLASAHCEMLRKPMQQAPHLGWRCLQGPHLGHQNSITVPFPCQRPAARPRFSTLLSP